MNEKLPDSQKPPVVRTHQAMNTAFTVTSDPGMVKGTMPTGTNSA